MSKKLLITILAAILPMLASAYDALVDGLYYKLNSTDHTAEVTFLNFINNESMGNQHTYEGDVVIPNEVTFEGISYTVTAVGASAFNGQSYLTSVTIPTSVTTIGSYAFEKCSGLTSIDIPNSVTSIGISAFKRCSNINSFNIPNSVTSIGYFAFLETGWENSHPLGIVYVGDCAVGYRGTMTGEVAFKDGTRLICDDILMECYGVTKVKIPNSVKIIGKGAFDHCENMSTAIIGDGVTTIGDNAFMNCKSLVNLTIGQSVTTIGASAFSLCNKLANITFPDNVSIIGGDAFGDTPWYDNQPDGLIYVGKTAYIYKGTMPENTSITIKEGTLCIAGTAFRECTNLTSISIPNSVTSIGGWAFVDCSGLTTIDLPNSVTTLEQSAFLGCNNITTVTIGTGMKSIGKNAFGNCTALNRVTVMAEIPPVASKETFSNYQIELIVPESSAETYSTAVPWNQFTTIKTLGGAEVQKKKCAMPTITEYDGYLLLGCETEGVTYHFNYAYGNSFTGGSTGGNILPFSKRIVVTVYASKEGWEDSDTATMEFKDTPIVGDLNNDGTVNAADHVKLSDIIMGK